MLIVHKVILLQGQTYVKVYEISKACINSTKFYYDPVIYYYCFGGLLFKMWDGFKKTFRLKILKWFINEYVKPVIESNKHP